MHNIKGCNYYSVESGKEFKQTMNNWENILIPSAFDVNLVLNCKDITVTGNKRKQIIYKRHSGRPGSMKIETFTELQNRIPNRIIEKSVKGMLPKGKLGRELFTQLKVYEEDIHPHNSQKPQILIIN